MQCRRYNPSADIEPWLVYGWEWLLSEGFLIPEIFPGTGAEILFNMGEKVSIKTTSLTSLSSSREDIVESGAAVLLCPRRSRLSFVTSGYVHFLALRLRSAACFELFGVPVAHICDQVLKLNELGIKPPTPDFIYEQGYRVLGQWIRQQINRRPNREYGLTEEIEMLYRGSSNIELQERLGMNIRTLQRRLHCYIGVDARYFQRTARFQRTLRRLLSGVPLLDSLSYEGYYDQPHFIKNCQLFSQRSPKLLLTAEHKILNHYNPLINNLVDFL